MTNISKRTLKKEFADELYEQFVSIISTPSKSLKGELLTSLFSDAERTMFVKRLAVIVLLQKGISRYKIAHQLFVSEVTVCTIQEQIEEGKYKILITHIGKKTFDREKFWKTVELVLRAGMPPRGKGRWKWLYEMTDDMEKQ